jgi:hypothetical protein
MADFEKLMFNRLNAVDCPACGLEALSTHPYPATVGDDVTITCGSCGGVGVAPFLDTWQYTDLNAYPLEQTLNRHYARASKSERSDTDGRGVLKWD